MNIIKHGVLGISVTTLFLTGCGSSPDSSYLTDSSSATVFPADATTAEPTVDNGTEVRDIVAQNQNTSFAPTSNDTQNSNLMLALGDIYKTLDDITVGTGMTTKEVASGSYECPSGGSYQYSASGSESDAIFSVDYNSCDIYGILYDGSISIHSQSYDETTSTFKYSETEFLTDFDIQLNGQNMKIYKGGTMDMEVLSSDSYGNVDKIKLGINMITAVDDEKGGQKDASYIIETIDSYRSSIYQTTGRIYINNLESYVDYDTSYDMSQTPFVFYNNVLESGEAYYDMNGGKLKIKVESNQAVVYVDSNNDGVYELSEY